MDNNTRLRGLGDVIAKVTAAVGIKPCGGCNQRQAALNKLIPFSGKLIPDGYELRMQGFKDGKQILLAETTAASWGVFEYNEDTQRSKPLKVTNDHDVALNHFNVAMGSR